MKESEIIKLFYGEGFHFLDDCSVLPQTPNHLKTLVTTDSMTQGTHFRSDWSTPRQLAKKLFHVNLSDLAVSGGDPAWCLLNLGLPKNASDDFLKEFAQALLQETEHYACPLIGGDTYRSRQIDLTLTMGGGCRRHIARTGGKPGDVLYCTGDLGLSAAGQLLLEGRISIPDLPLSEDPDYESHTLSERAREKHLSPRARFDWAKKISTKEGVHASIDLSDGLAADATRLAAASNVVLRIDLDKIPMLPDLEPFVTRQKAAVSGEELEILFLGEPGLTFPFPCVEIGRAELAERSESANDDEEAMGHNTETSSHIILERNGREIQLGMKGFEHFNQE